MIWKESAKGHSLIPACIWRDWEKPRETCHDSQCPDLDSKRAASEYESEALPLCQPVRRETWISHRVKALWDFLSTVMSRYAAIRQHSEHYCPCAHWQTAKWLIDCKIDVSCSFYSLLLYSFFLAVSFVATTHRLNTFTHTYNMNQRATIILQTT
jgi:hypothetical protein